MHHRTKLASAANAARGKCQNFSKKETRSQKFQAQKMPPSFTPAEQARLLNSHFNILNNNLCLIQKTNKNIK